MTFRTGNYFKSPIHSMKKSVSCFLLLLFAIACSIGCKKQIEQLKSDALTDYLAANKWAVQQYLEGTTDVTAEFDSYEFIFYNNNTVTGTKGTATYSGTWSSNISNVTMTAQFATGTPAPASRLNGTWGVASYNSTATTFSQTINGIEMKLILRKK